MNKSYEEEWYEEMHIAKHIRDYLTNNGYEITRFNEDKMLHGNDLIAVKNGKELIIEVKGFPSRYYVRGPKAGLPKPTHPNLQAKHWFSDALRALMNAKSVNLDAEIAFGFPECKKYHDFIDKISPLLGRLDCHCYFVDQNGSIKYQ